VSAIRRRNLHIDDPLGGAASSDPDHGPTIASDRRGDGAGRLREIPLDQIRPNPQQPRKRFDESSLASLAESIRERGVLQPIIVRPVEQGFEVVAGERRWHAAQLAGEATIPALIDDAVDDAGSLELALIENVVRENLTPIEQARSPP
jgi:ParB family transcriptional regulator, chromosome partitioning protein